jgi:hypothetical protein
VGGVLYQLTPAVLLSVMVSHVNYVSIFWYPLILLLWGQTARAVGRGSIGIGWTIGLGVALYGLLLTDLQHAIFLSVLVVPYGVFSLLTAKSWAVRLKLLAAAGGSVALALLLLWFAGPLPYLLTFDRGSLAPQPIENAQGIPFPVGYFARAGLWERRVSLGAFTLPGALLALLASRTIWRGQRPDRQRWFWLGVLSLPLLLSLGPAIQIGNAAIPTPYVWLHELFGGLFRVPARFAPVIVLAALMFIGRSWTPHLPRQPQARLWLICGLLLLVSAEVLLYGQMPLRPVVPSYHFYEAMRAEPYEYVVVEVPVAGGSGEAWVGELPAMETQFYGIIHEKKMLNGSVARAPVDAFEDWLYDDPLLAWLGQRRYLEPEPVADLLRERIFSYPIGYIVIHRDLVGRGAAANQEIIGYFNSLPDLVCPLWVEGDAVVFRTAWHPAGCPARTPPVIETGVFQIDIGEPGDERYLGWGWHSSETLPGLTIRWMGQPRAALYVDLPPADLQIEMIAQSFHRERALDVLVNGTQVGRTVVPPDSLTPLRFDLPAALVGDGQHLALELMTDLPERPADLGLGEDARPLALMIDQIRFVSR